MSVQNAAMGGNLIALLPRLRRYARVLTGTLERADGLVRATLACAMERRLPGRQQTMPLAWFLAIMRELYVAESFGSQRTSAGLPRDTANGIGDLRRIAPTGTGAQASRTEAAETLAHFCRLTVEQREVLVLVTVEGLPYAEIAALLGVPVATVMATLKCARESMHAMASTSCERGKLAN